MVFFPEVLAFFSEITNIWQKSRDFLFADFFSGFLTSIGWYGFSSGFLVVLNVFHQCFVYHSQKLLKPKNTVRSIFVS
jgi:hypothetical protein